jgi:hypothetical protein
MGRGGNGRTHLSARPHHSRLKPEPNFEVEPVFPQTCAVTEGVGKGFTGCDDGLGLLVRFASVSAEGKRESREETNLESKCRHSVRRRFLPPAVIYELFSEELDLGKVEVVCFLVGAGRAVVAVDEGFCENSVQIGFVRPYCAQMWEAASDERRGGGKRETYRSTGP